MIAATATAKVDNIGMQIYLLIEDLKECRFTRESATKKNQSLEDTTGQNLAITLKQADAVLEELRNLRMCVAYVEPHKGAAQSCIKQDKAA